MSEKKLSPVTEKKETKPVTPTKTIKTNVVGRRPGPKSSKLFIISFRIFVIINNYNLT